MGLKELIWQENEVRGRAGQALGGSAPPGQPGAALGETRPSLTGLEAQQVLNRMTHWLAGSVETGHSEAAASDPQLRGRTHRPRNPGA